MSSVRTPSDAAEAIDRGSAVREAVLLPLLFLGAAAAAAVRVAPDGRLALVGPSLVGLVLGSALCLLALRAGLVRPERLIAPRRSGLANANGLVALAAWLFASGQVFTLLMPEAGLMAVLFGAFYLALLSQAAAAGTDGPRLLRGLLVLFGAGLLLRFTLLNGLAAPDGSLARRVFASALDGLTPGGLGLEHHAAATGYAAFLALLLYVAGLVSLPGDHSPWEALGAADGSPRRPR
jgi:hypothetical protein